jgi:hypothetical protein
MLRVLGLLLIVAACAAEPSTETDAGAPVDAGLPPAFTLRLRFVSDDGPEQIYLQTGTMEGPQSWVRLMRPDGSRVELYGSCAVCECGRCNDCGVCGAAMPRVDALVAGGHRDEPFAGHFFAYESCGGNGTCFRRTPLPPGEYVARFCWGTTATGAGMDQSISNQRCADVPFTAPVVSGLVEHLVDHGG